MKKLSRILAIVVVLSMAALATDITGTWNAKVKVGDQTGSPTFVLKQDGDRVTGTYSGALGEAQVKGTVHGSKVTFDFTASGAMINFEGTVNTDGTEMEGTCDYGGQAEGTFKAKKAEKK